MAKDPQYVRLNDNLADHGSLADVSGSGWSIGGSDVQEFPADDDDAVDFVRTKLRLGVLEPASRAEYDEAHPEEEPFEVERKMVVEIPHQEGRLHKEVKAGRARMRAAREEQTEKVMASSFYDEVDVGAEDDSIPLEGLTPLTTAEQRQRRVAEREEAKSTRSRGRKSQESEASS
jgi:hypothetical protein